MSICRVEMGVMDGQAVLESPYGQGKKPYIFIDKSGSRISSEMKVSFKLDGASSPREVHRFMQEQGPLLSKEGLTMMQTIKLENKNVIWIEKTTLPIGFKACLIKIIAFVSAVFSFFRNSGKTDVFLVQDVRTQAALLLNLWDNFTEDKKLIKDLNCLIQIQRELDGFEINNCNQMICQKDTEQFWIKRSMNLTKEKYQENVFRLRTSLKSKAEEMKNALLKVEISSKDASWLRIAKQKIQKEKSSLIREMKRLTRSVLFKTKVDMQIVDIHQSKLGRISSMPVNFSDRYMKGSQNIYLRDSNDLSVQNHIEGIRTKKGESEYVKQKRPGTFKELSSYDKVSLGDFSRALNCEMYAAVQSQICKGAFHLSPLLEGGVRSWIIFELISLIQEMPDKYRNPSILAGDLKVRIKKNNKKIESINKEIFSDLYCGMQKNKTIPDCEVKDLQNAPEYMGALWDFQHKTWRDEEEKEITFTQIEDEILNEMNQMIDVFAQDVDVGKCLALLEV